ncbi:MAG: PAS domain-containing protein [Actinobacteria bacterium]|nr:PAS domain-containing protein [Actinomycetota bacterium]
MMTIRHVAGEGAGPMRDVMRSEEEREYREIASEFLRSLRGRLPFDLGMVLMENEKDGYLYVISTLSDQPMPRRLERAVSAWRISRETLLRMHEEGLRNTPSIRIHLQRFGVLHCSYQVMNIDGSRSVLVLLGDREEDRREERLKGHFTSLCHQMADNLGYTIYRRREQRRMRHLRALVEVSRIVAETYELPLLIEKTLASINEHFNTSLSCVLLYDQADLERIASISMHVHGRTVSMDPDMRNRLLRRARETGMEPLAERLEAAAEGSEGGVELPIIEVPVRVDGRKVGAIKCTMRDYLSVDEMDMEFLNALANHLAAGIKNSLNYRRVEQRSETLSWLNTVIARLNDMLDGEEMVSFLARELRELAGAEHALFVPTRHGLERRPVGREETAWREWLDRETCSRDGRKEALLFGCGKNGAPAETGECMVIDVRDGKEDYGTFVLLSSEEGRMRAEEVAEILPALEGSVVSALRRVDYLSQALDERGKLEAVFDAMRDAVLVVDGEGRLAAANSEAERLFGLRERGGVGSRLEDILEIPELASFALGGGAKGGSGDEADMVIPVSPPKAVRAYRSAVMLPGGVDKGRVVVLGDVTHEKDLDRLKESFLSCVSHELNTPLAIIIGYTDILREGWQAHPEETKRQYVDSIKRSAERLHRVVADILTASRISRGRLELDTRLCLLDEIAEDMVDQYRLIDPSHRYELWCREPGCLCEADEVKIRRVVWNLVDNARKFSQPGSRIAVSVGRRGGSVFISVKDEGIGISPWHLPSVFSKFSQVDDGDARKAPGLGIGLYLAREIVEAHGGTLEVWSRPDQGSVFTLVLPAVEEREAEERAALKTTMMCRHAQQGAGCSA